MFLLPRQKGAVNLNSKKVIYILLDNRKTAIRMYVFPHTYHYYYYFSIKLYIGII